MPPSRQAPTIAARADVERAGAGRAEQRLVAGKCEQVDAHRLHVDRHHAGRLGGIDEEEQIRSREQFRRCRAIGCTVPRTLLACVRAMSRVFGVMALRMASGSTVPPPSAAMRVRVILPASSIARSGRLTLLCSRSVVMT